MTDHVNVVVTSATGPLVLRLSGELDISTVDACRADLTDAIEDRLHRQPYDAAVEPGLARVVIDLSGLTFVAVAGLRMLAGIAARIERHHVTAVAAVPPTGIVRQLVHLTELDQQMRIVDASNHNGSADATTASALTKARRDVTVARHRGAVFDATRPRTTSRFVG